MNKNEAKKKRLQKYFANSIQLVYNSIQLSKYLLAFLYLSSLLRLQEIEKKNHKRLFGTFFEYNEPIRRKLIQRVFIDKLST